MPAETHTFDPARSSGSSGQTARIFGLDLLRALAIVFVVHDHGSLLLRRNFDRHLTQALVPDGVAIFFVLSGFLIGGILLRTIERAPFTPAVLGRFWVRRWFRTLPNYFLVLAVLFAIHSTFGDLRWQEVLPYGLFLQNLTTPHPRFYAEAWSLSIEEWFYIGFPLALLVLIRLGVDRRHAVLATIIAVIAATFAWRTTLFIGLETYDLAGWDGGFRKLVTTRMDGLMLGVFGAYLSQYHSEAWRRARGPLLVAGIALVLIHQYLDYLQPERLASWPAYYYVFSFALVSVGTLCVLPGLSTLERSRSIFTAAITYLSRVSYSMYLLHFSLTLYFLLGRVRPWLPEVERMSEGPMLYAVYWALTLGLATLLHRFFEAPAMGLRDRITQRTEGASRP